MDGARTKPLLWLGMLALGTLACVLGSTTPTPPTASNVLFQDDFADPASGWDRFHGPDVAMDYENGVYHIQVFVPNQDFWSNPGLLFTDVRIEVDVAKIGGPDDNDFGVLCRYDPSGPNFYAFLISSDGYYGILKQQGRQQQLLNGPQMDISDAIATGLARNHLTVLCQGDTLALQVNGVPLTRVQDGDFTAGDIGLLAGTFEAPGTSVIFDNLSVLSP